MFIQSICMRSSFSTNLDNNVTKVVGEEHEVPSAVVHQFLVVSLLIFLVLPDQVAPVPQLVPDTELDHRLLVFLPAVAELLLNRGRESLPAHFTPYKIFYFWVDGRHVDYNITSENIR